MKVLHVVTGLHDGGAEAILYRLCTNSTDHRHIVISLTEEGKYCPKLRELGITVHTLDMPRGRLTLRGISKLWRLLQQESPDLVQTWMYHGDLLGGITARLHGIRAVCWGIHHTNLEPGKSKLGTILVARLCAILSHWVPRRIACCAERSVTVHQALGYDANRCVVVRNGYDTSVFAPDERQGKALRATLGLSKECRALGLVGRFDPQKDHANLLAALARVRAGGREFKVVLAGPGITPTNEILMDLIAKAGLRDATYVLGRRDDVPVIMNAIDVHVLSSSFGEASPNVLAEAMACGTPCVTTNVGDAAIIVGDTGWVVPPSDPEALANAIIGALVEREDEGLWRARQEAARARIEAEFGLARMVHGYEQLWMEASTPTRAVSEKW